MLQQHNFISSSNKLNFSLWVTGPNAVWWLFLQCKHVASHAASITVTLLNNDSSWLSDNHIDCRDPHGGHFKATWLMIMEGVI